MAQQYTLSGESANEPYKDPDLLRRLYCSEELSLRGITEKLDCHFSTVHEYMEEFEIERRKAEYDPVKDRKATNTQHNNGYEMWVDESDVVLVHRLVAVAKEGFNAVCDGIVHHKNGVHWDNRPGNLTVLNSVREHQRVHGKPDIPDDQSTLAE